MTRTTIYFPDFLAEALGALFARRDTPKPSPLQPVDPGARRAFICELLDKSGSALTSEADVQVLMQVYAREF